jgi:hypothetical protein
MGQRRSIPQGRIAAQQLDDVGHKHQPEEEPLEQKHR